MKLDGVRADPGTFRYRTPVAGVAEPTGAYQRLLKRPTDVVLSLVILAAAAPLMLAIALCLVASGTSPIFAHKRVGKDGRAFSCYKFRTMHKDSSRLLRLILRTDSSAAREWADDQKLSFDPRITRLGRFLRATSLDELPQLFNVLRGDMSMVGPRPVTEGELRHYRGRLPMYLSMRPGLTGPWQVFGRGATTYAERVEMDCTYAEQCGPLDDLWLVLCTVRVVFGKSGI